ncbi:nitrogenase molybdenum-iron protein alpha chain [Sporobacter termitidis DSM 10068]|uniref:Nitrogenase molybdenum-iron protein alpha chain n=1 Tax=Sporobacter termitidis DSM 10068 TaxID=1123282 RepID=A0A1M5TUZ0_9FIRM|nr:nitrogenase component 1 [Sporobacter termitidis]SHH54450.1 nitrogenase molybdenum-iron protein alpha chain [Sporobacter termitidis DSM 10068]
MNYLNAKSAPAREDRLKTNIAYGGTCADVKDCLKSGCFGAGGCLNLAGRRFSQTHGCQFTLSLAILNTLRNAVIIMHAPIGCGSCSIGNVGVNKSFKQLRDPKAEGVIWLNTNLDEADVISGGERKLREAVLYADREFRPETIIVANGCVPSLIGDDIDSILSDLQNQTAANIVPIHCEGFKTKVMATAYDAVYHGILKRYVKTPDRRTQLAETDLDKLTEQYRISRNVNILNVGSMSRADELELQRLLNAIGLNVTFIPCYAEPEDFEYALETSLNVSICGTHDDYFVEHLKETYNIPFIVDTIPIGRKNTDRWLLRIASHFGLEKEAQQLIALENKQLDASLAPYRKALRGKRVFLAGGEVRIIATAEILQDLGLTVVGFKAHHFDQFIEPMFDALENIDDVLVDVATNQPFEQSNLLERIKPDIFIAHTGGNNISAKHGIPILPLFGPSYNYLGYSGVFEVARRLNKTARNGQFNKKLAQNLKLPYRSDWYAKDPFTYIKQQDAV